MHNPDGARSRAQITVRDLTLALGGETIIQHLNLTIDTTSRTAIVGENGRGKSTLLRALAGFLEPASGAVIRHGRFGIAEQDMPVDGERTVGDAIAFAIQDSLTALTKLDSAAGALAAGIASAEEAYAAALEQATSLDAWDAERRITIALEALGAETARTRPLDTLSVGQRYRVRLACLLGGDAEILLLDEPTNHLDAAALDYLTDRLRAGGKGFALVSHDRRLLRDIANAFVDLDPSSDGLPRITGGDYEAWAERKRSDRARWEQSYREQVDQEMKLRDDLQAARSRLVDGWRPPKGTGKHQRATRAAGLVTNVKQRQAELDAKLVDVPEPPLRFTVPGWRSTAAGTLLSAERIMSAGRLNEPVSVTLRAGERLLVRGPNGSGKSTLLGMLAGRLEPTAGTLRRKPGCRVVLLAQESEMHRVDASMNSAAVVYRERAAQLVSRSEISASRVVPLEQLGLLSRAERAKPVAALSLGQQRRLDLALALLAQPDVLLLDEPTNHLSIPLVDDLTRAFSTLPCALVVSTHDRGMLDDLSIWPAVALSGQDLGDNA